MVKKKNPLMKKKLHFVKPWILINDPLDYVSAKKETQYVRWGFCFKAPLDKSWNSWRWLWIKMFDKLYFIRWTMGRIYWG